LIDLHAHVLPGFDDGVRSLEEARALVRSAGVTAIAATPHVRADYPTSAVRMERGVAALRGDFAEQGIDVEVVSGGEVALERLWQLDDDEIRRFTYGGGGRYLLVEPVDHGWPPLLEQSVAALAAAGIRAVVAHPERNDAVQAEPARLRPLVERGAVVQVTAGSLTGSLGRAPRDAAHALLDLGLVHLVASDAHGPHVARAGLADAAAAVGAELAGRLLVEAPRAILDGRDV
jgi:protein-tyrosine phosphatase